VTRQILLVAKRDDIAAEVTTGLAGTPDLSFFRVASPERAIALIDGEHGDEYGPYSLVIADNDTHPAGGFYLAKELAWRRDEGHAAPPLLLILARPQDTWLSDWSRADAYCVRPVDPFDLAEAVEALSAGEPLPELPGIGGEPATAPYGLDDDRERARRRAATSGERARPISPKGESS